MRGKKGNRNSDGLANLSRISICEPFLWGPKTNSTCIIFSPPTNESHSSTCGNKELGFEDHSPPYKWPIYHHLLHLPLHHLSFSSHWCRPITTISCHLLILTPTQCAGPPLFFESLPYTNSQSKKAIHTDNSLLVFKNFPNH